MNDQQHPQRRAEDVCVAHSGNEARAKLMLWLMGILIALMISTGGSMIVMMLGVKTDIAVLTTNQVVTSVKFQAAETERMQLKNEMDQLLKRLDRLEEYEYGHVEHSPKTGSTIRVK